MNRPGVTFRGEIRLCRIRNESLFISEVFEIIIVKNAFEPRRGYTADRCGNDVDGLAVIVHVKNHYVHVARVRVVVYKILQSFRIRTAAHRFEILRRKRRACSRYFVTLKPYVKSRIKNYFEYPYYAEHEYGHKHENYPEIESYRTETVFFTRQNPRRILFGCCVG